MTRPGGAHHLSGAISGAAEGAPAHPYTRVERGRVPASEETRVRITNGAGKRKYTRQGAARLQMLPYNEALGDS